jgi:hypothetical protein
MMVVAVETTSLLASGDGSWEERRRWWLVSVLSAQALVWMVCIYTHTLLGRMDEMARLG